MSNEHRQALLDQYEEASMMLLMDEYAEADGARLLQEFEEAEKNGEVPEVPATLDAKCRELIQTSFTKQNGIRRFTKLARAFGKAAVFLFAFLGLTATMVFSVDAFRIPVLNFFLDHSERYTSVAFDDQSQYPAMDSKDLAESIAPLLPSGYQLVSADITGEGMCFILFQDKEEHIISLNTCPSSGQLFIDTEDSAQEEITLNGQRAVFIDKDGYRVIWADADAGSAFDLFANGLDLTTFHKLAYSISTLETN